MMLTGNTFSWLKIPSEFAGLLVPPRSFRLCFHSVHDECMMLDRNFFWVSDVKRFRRLFPMWSPLTCKTAAMCASTSQSFTILTYIYVYFDETLHVNWHITFYNYIYIYIYLCGHLGGVWLATRVEPRVRNVVFPSHSDYHNRSANQSQISVIKIRQY